MSTADETVAGLARREDNARLCEIFKAVSMKADLHLTVERDPDFFALYDLQEVEQRVITWTVDGAIEGVACILGRECWLDGKRTPTAYLGDLRYTRRIRGGTVLGKFYGPLFDKWSADLGCELMLTAVILSNRAAVKALIERSERFPTKPVYTLVREFTIQNVQFTARRKPLATRFSVRRAREADIPAIAARLAEDHRGRVFGYVFSEALLRARLERWPDFGIDSFFLAFDGERLVGLTAPWDAHAVKRFRVMGYHNKMRWLKRAYNAYAWLRGFERLPPVGGEFRYFYLTHTSVVGEDPEVMASLLDAVYRAFWGKGYHFFSSCVLEGDPLAAPYRRYRCEGLPAGLYAVSAPGNRYNTMDFGRARPGLEMALV